MPLDPRQEIRHAVRHQVGLFFRNVFPVGAGVCRACRGPAPTTSQFCGKCGSHWREFGSQLADQTLFLTYAQGWHPDGRHQSAHTVRSYKEQPPAPESMTRLKLVMKSASVLHGRCMTAAVGGGNWDVVTFVPSARRPGIEHPVHELMLAAVAGSVGKGTLRILLSPKDMSVQHLLTADRFSIADEYRDVIRDAKVLVVDDTWTTGANLQSAAVVLKAAGAASVTGLCVDRWLNWTWEEHVPLLKSLRTLYDPLVCPVGPGCLM